MNRRQALRWGCAHCAAMTLGLESAVAQNSPTAPWAAPPRFVRPDASTDEGGLWAMLDREETRVRRSPFRIKEPGLQTYLDGINAKLSKEHAPDIRLYPLFTPMFNASMAPNGMMQLWSGLLLRMENEAQLAAVVGHEIGHYLQRHTVERLRDAKARSAFGQFMGMFGLVGMVAQLATAASAFGFSRDQERQADDIGMQLMRDGGYDTREAAKVWANLVAEMQAAGDDQAASGGAMFATHPGAAERSQTLSELAAGDSGGYTGEAEYAAQMAPFRSRMLEEELRRNQPAGSLTLLTRMLSRQSADAELLYTRAELYRARAGEGDTDLALADLHRAVATGQEIPLTHRALGQIFQSQGLHEQAGTAYRTYLEREPLAADAALVLQAIKEMKP